MPDPNILRDPLSLDRVVIKVSTMDASKIEAIKRAIQNEFLQIPATDWWLESSLVLDGDSPGTISVEASFDAYRPLRPTAEEFRRLVEAVQYVNENPCHVWLDIAAFAWVTLDSDD
jgi:hypothetical protein